MSFFISASERSYIPLKVILESKILGDQKRLTILLHHMKIIRWIDLSLKQNSVGHSMISPKSKGGSGSAYVLTAYLKNSVTRFVDPFKVIAWRLACFVGAMAYARGKESGGS